MSEKPRFNAVLDRIGGGRVLHVGCVGHGPDSEWFHGELAQLDIGLFGVDIDGEGIASIPERFDVRVDDAQELATVTESVDTIVATEVIEHLSEPGRFFEAAERVLKPHGTVLITTPNPWAACYIRRVVTGSDPVGNDEHTCWFDKTTLEELAGRYGFTGAVEHLPPMSGGVTMLCWRAGHRRLGGTRLFAEFELE